MKYILMTLLFIPSVFAKVTFYTGGNCRGYSFSRFGGEIPNLKKVTYEYPCVVTRSYGHDGDIEVEEQATCTGDFNDKLESIDISEGEQVELFEAKNFEQRVESFSGKGCHAIGELWDLGSSLKIYN